MKRAAVKAVFFDVDFTLIYPGPTFQGAGYEQFCARYGIRVDTDRFTDAVRAASEASCARFLNRGDLRTASRCWARNSSSIRRLTRERSRNTRSETIE